jgi:hypothetical protein
MGEAQAGAIAWALRRAGALLLEPAPPAARGRAVPLEVVVTGLVAGAGATTVARGLTDALRRTRPAELGDMEPTGAVAAGPGTAVIRDAAPAEAGRMRHRGRGRVVVAVADGRREPALAVLVCGVLAERHDRVVLVANRVHEPDAWHDSGALCVPDSRFGAWLLGRGRYAPGAMGVAFERLAETVQGES